MIGGSNPFLPTNDVRNPTIGERDYKAIEITRDKNNSGIIKIEFISQAGTDTSVLELCIFEMKAVILRGLLPRNDFSGKVHRETCILNVMLG